MTLRVLGAGAAAGLIGHLKARIDREISGGIAVEYQAVGVIDERLKAGEEVDILISSDAHIARYAQEGRVLAGSIASLGRVETGMAVREGAPHPDIATGPAFLAALRAAPEIYHPDMQRGTAGIHLAQVLERAGMREELEGRLRACRNGADTMHHLAQGAPGAIGFAQATEIVHSSGVTYVGALPPGYDLATAYDLALVATARNRAAAECFRALLCGGETAGARLACGFR